MRMKVGGLDVLASGTLVAQAGDPIHLYPFADDEDFLFVIRPNFTEAGTRSVQLMRGDGLKEIIVEFTSPFRDSMVVSNAAPLSFADEPDKNEEYLTNISIAAVGSLQKHTLTINYTFLIRKLV